MKKFLCALLVLVLMFTSVVPSLAASNEYPIRAYYTATVVKELKQILLVPSSLDMRSISYADITTEEGNRSYHFFVIRYVAKNKMGGYTDSVAYALSTEKIGPFQIILSIDGESTHGVYSGLMQSDLYSTILKYLVGDLRNMSVVSVNDVTNIIKKNLITPDITAATEKPQSIVKGTYIVADNGDGTGTITRYIGEEENVIIPDTINGLKITAIGDGAFDMYIDDVYRKVSHMKTLSIPSSVKSIGRYAFRDCRKLVSVSIPDSVTYIGDYAFKNCEELVSVSIPDSVTSIGECAFGRCCKLKEFIIPDSVLHCGDGVVAGCDNLRSILVSANHPTLSVVDGVLYSKDGSRLLCCPVKKSWGEESYSVLEGTTSIGNYAFQNCEIRGIILPDTVMTIGSRAFSGSWLRKIQFSKGVTYIGDEAFRYCPSLQSVFIPESVKYIGDSAFALCKKLTSFEFDEECTAELGMCLFIDCSALDSVYIPNGINKISGSPIVSVKVSAEHPSLTILNGALYDKEEKVLLSCPQSYKATAFIIPLGITGIAPYAFYKCASLEQIIVPNSITAIGESAFEYCENLTNIILPDSVTSIGKSAFASCKNLTNITIPNGVTSIGESAFASCKNLTNIILPDSVTSIGESAFEYCENLTNITIPNGVTSIGESAFASCKNLTNIILPDSVTSIGKSAFASCKNLTNITIPNGVTSIGESAFASCKNLTNIILPDSVTSIGERVFAYCENLTNITIPNGVTSIGKHAFTACDALKTITIPKGVALIAPDAFCEDVMLTVDYGSYAEQYAIEHSLAYTVSEDSMNEIDWLN